MGLKKVPGLEAEQLAAKYLRRQGYRMLAERCLTGYGELDLICRVGRTLVFVEVKSAARGAGIDPEEKIGAEKIAHIVKSAKAWLQQKKLSGLKVRFDVVAVDLAKKPPEFRHYPASFESPFDF